MGVEHVALYAVTVAVLCALMAPASASRAQAPFYPSASSNYDVLKQQAYISRYQPNSRVTITSPHSVISSTPIPPLSTNGTTKIEVCMDCITFMQNNLQTLIEIVTKIGVTDTCDKICGLLNNSVDVDACNVLCDAYGSEKFWQLFVSAGINPIYACVLVNACSAGPAPAVAFGSSSISPTIGPQGTIFQFKVEFTVINETGVGESAFVIYYPTNSDHELGYISQSVFADYLPGSYSASLSFPTNASFVVGKYLVMFDLCSGACGQDPNPYPFASEEFSFNITASR